MEFRAESEAQRFRWNGNMGWFTKIDAGILDWEVVHWRWLVGNLRSRFDLNHVRLITPTPEDFPIVAGSADQKVAAVFRCVQKHFGFEKWPCRLEPFEEADDITREFAPVLFRPTSTSGAAGLFDITGSQEVVIRYKTKLLDDPVTLVATLAHELSHYVVASIEETPPTGWAWREPITDLTAIFFGFGIFLANSAFRFAQWQDIQYRGWSAHQLGYLSEEASSLALALFCASKNLPLEPVRTYLATNPRSYFKAYCKELVKCHGEIVSQLPTATKVPRRVDFSCPGCCTLPPTGNFWFCDACGKSFDTFATGAKCPTCRETFATTTCLACSGQYPMSQWKFGVNAAEPPAAGDGFTRA